MIKIWLLSFFLITSSFASECRIPKNEKLIIGCSYQCEFMYQLRLTLSAMFMGYPVRIVDLRDMGSLPDSMTKVDGILMPGGADIDPDIYLSRLEPSMQDYIKKNLHLVNFSKEGKERDQYESDLLSVYNEDDRFKTLPFLGICRGMQMMTVAQSIPLFLDIKTEVGIKNRRYLFDRVSISQSSLMSELYSSRNEIRAYKLHHQGLRLPAYSEEKYPKVKITAFSNKGKIVEAIEYTHRPALGVQYHPEMSFSSAAQPVLKWFLRKSCEYKNLTKAQL